MDMKLSEWKSTRPSDWVESVSVFVWGQGDNGQLGLAAISASSPTVNNNIGKLNPISVVGGERCSFVLTEQGLVYAFGHGEYGRLGVPDTHGRRDLTLIDFNGAKIVAIKSATSSYGFSMALDSEGRLYSWGDGDFGKLGHGDRSQQLVPKLMNFLLPYTITNFHTGPKHGAAVTSEGKLYVWGEGDDGRIGNGSSSTQETPTLIALEDVCDVSCGSDFTIALTNNGRQVWSWGCNSYGQLGVGNDENASVPKSIEFPFEVKPFIKVVTGDSFTGLLSSDGKVYTFGNGEYGSLGLTDICSVETPKQVDLPGHFVIDIVAGNTFMIALTKEGKVFSWGSNDYGELGLGHTNSIYYPTEVNFPNCKKIDFIAAGSNHALAFVRIQDLNKLLPEKIPDEYSILEPYFNSEMVIRAKILQQFSDMFLSCVNLFTLDPKENLSFGLENLVWLLQSAEKQSLLRQYITSTTSSSDHGPEIRLNRFLADHAPKTHNLFTQVYNALQNKSIASLMAKRAWRVELVGEGSIDAGGPYNESVSHLASELQNGHVCILQQTPNAKNNFGDYHDCVFPDPECKEWELFEFLGKFFGIAVRSKAPLGISLPPCFWKFILSQNITLNDLEEIDEQFVNAHKCLLHLDSEITESDFEFLPLENFPSLITENNQKIDLHYKNREDYVKLAIKQKVQSYEKAFDKIRNGFSQFIPIGHLRFFSPTELGILVCGTSTFDWELLKKCTIYSDTDKDAPIIIWLWEVLESLSLHDSGLFLRFVWGKSRLPHSVSDFSQSFDISVSNKGDLALPTGTTCSFRLGLPLYSSKEILEKKLLFAIRNCRSVDTDNNVGLVDLELSQLDLID